MPTDVELVRLVLARELETINQYEQASREAESELVRSFFRHLADEEKEHVAEATLLLQQLDAAQLAHFATAEVGAEHFGGNTPRERVEAARSAAPQHLFTVGSLKKRKDVP